MVTPMATADQRPVASGVHATASARRRIAIDALGSQLDARDASSAASRLRLALSGAPRPLVISGDIDGVVSAAMLTSVAPGWNVVAILCQSQKLLVHESVASGRPHDIFGLDLFSVEFDNVSNHVVKFGRKRLQREPIRQAFNEWDECVQDAASTRRLLAVPSLWAGTQACYEDADHADSAKYKYPLGTAQLLLALLEACGRPPRFYDRHFLPWLIANCDGGISTYQQHAYNAGVWWPTLAAAVGPASLTEQVYQRVATMRPHDFIDAVNRLDRERQAQDQPRWLDDDWNLINQSPVTLERAIGWLCELTGWRDPVRGGHESLGSWLAVDVLAEDRASVYLSGEKLKETVANPEAAAVAIRGARTAINANFYFGGFTGSRFNWAGRW